MRNLQILAVNDVVLPSHWFAVTLWRGIRRWFRLRDDSVCVYGSVWCQMLERVVLVAGSVLWGSGTTVHQLVYGRAAAETVLFLSRFCPSVGAFLYVRSSVVVGLIVVVCVDGKRSLYLERPWTPHTECFPSTRNRTGGCFPSRWFSVSLWRGICRCVVLFIYGLSRLQDGSVCLGFCMTKDSVRWKGSAVWWLQIMCVFVYTQKI